MSDPLPTPNIGNHTIRREHTAVPKTKKEAHRLSPHRWRDAAFTASSSPTDPLWGLKI